MDDGAGYQSKNSRKKLLFKFPSIYFIKPASPSGIYGTLLIPLMLLTTLAEKKTLFTDIHVYLRGIDHFTVVRLATWPLNGSEARGDRVLIQTSLLLLCKSTCSYAN